MQSSDSITGFLTFQRADVITHPDDVDDAVIFGYYPDSPVDAAHRRNVAFTPVSLIRGFLLTACGRDRLSRRQTTPIHSCVCVTNELKYAKMDDGKKITGVYVSF